VQLLTRISTSSLTLLALAPTLVLALSGCAAPMGQPPPTGPKWAFYTDTNLTLGPRAVVYMDSQVACENERRRQLGASTDACVAVTVSAGPGYYAIELPSNVDSAIPGGATFGSLDLQKCERFRNDLFRAFSSVRGDCGSVSLRRAP
jgi:hypothetical protein